MQRNGSTKNVSSMERSRLPTAAFNARNTGHWMKLTGGTSKNKRTEEIFHVSKVQSICNRVSQISEVHVSSAEDWTKSWKKPSEMVQACLRMSLSSQGAG